MTTITRFNRYESQKWDRDNFLVHKYFVRGNNLECVVYSRFMEPDECLRKLYRHDSRNGALAIEDPTHEALDVFMTYYNADQEIPINWSMIEGEQFVVPPDLNVTDLRTDMKRGLNRNAKLSFLSKQVIILNCVGRNIYRLALPRVLIRYLKE